MERHFLAFLGVANKAQCKAKYQRHIAEEIHSLIELAQQMRYDRHDEYLGQMKA